MKASIAMLLVALVAVLLGITPPVSAQSEDHPITCEIDLNELTDADSQRLPPEFRNQAFLTPSEDNGVDFAEKKCTFSAPDQTVQIRCVRLVEDWPNAPSFSTKTFRNPCTISGVPECGVNILWTADNQTFKISPHASIPDAAVLELFCLRNMRG